MSTHKLNYESNNPPFVESKVCEESTNEYQQKLIKKMKKTRLYQNLEPRDHLKASFTTISRLLLTVDDVELKEIAFQQKLIFEEALEKLNQQILTK